MDRSRRRQKSGLSVLVLVASLLASPLMAHAEEAGLEAMALQLEVSINGSPRSVIAAFTLDYAQRMASTRGELLDLGIVAPGDGAPEDVVLLDSIPGLVYAYDEAAQAIDIRLGDEYRITQVYGGGSGDVVLPEIGTGFFTNYSLYASGSSGSDDDGDIFDGASLALDSHVYSGYGTFSQSDVFGYTPDGDSAYTRLDTTYTYTNVPDMLTASAGDFVSGGLNWTRPIRLGGAQWRRDFDTRPDLVTMPLPTFQGSAAVPSTVDVFINNVKTRSYDVGEGPFSLDSVPIVSGSGTARIVVRDAQGRETVTERPIYASAELLAPGLVDFSIEAGFARLNQGTESFDYDESPVASGSIRYGLTDVLTLEGHAEGGAGLANGGGGVVFNAGAIGTLEAAAALSLYDGDAGLLVHAGWEQQWSRLNASVSTTRLLGDYVDLAQVTASDDSSALLFSSIPIASDRATVGYSFRDWQTGLSASFIHAEYDDDRSDTNLLTASLTQRLPRDMSLYLTGYADVTDSDTIGIYAGVNIPLGQRMSAGASLQTRDGVTQGSASIMKSVSDEPGSVGWRAEYSEGDVRRGAASGTYMGSKAVAQGYLSAQEDYVYGNANVTGAVVAAGGGVFLGRSIYDGFAIVDAGAPAIDVYANNRLVGKTGRGGKILVPSLPAYQKNPVRIDSQDLPINAIVPTTEKQVVVARESGATVSFGVDTETNAALVTFRLADGSFVPAGTGVKFEGSAEDAAELVVGYDGQVYFDALAPQNTVVLEMESGNCTATFASSPSPDIQQTIEATCQ